ncbi:exodeoxyribonuclease V subunit gamma [Nakamurella sp. A5-74]|uniref:RecBCD enzyme subunit RecC n=1 Tax=Nakamurella sp. A5-74 TaxID=3158264 RepID=A0AAU8DRH1_9ACTN
MSLQLHRAQRSDALVRALAEVLSDPLPDPMTAEVVAVPAQGIERWISQRLSAILGASGPEHADGVSANIEFPSPARLVASTISLASGVAPQDDEWNPERLVWTVLAAIDDHLGAPGFEALTDHLGGVGSVLDQDATFDPIARATAVRRGRRLGVARRLAGLFDSYSRFRPSVLQAWAAGYDTDGCTDTGVPTAGPDGVLLAAARSWQPVLFRAVSEALALPSPAQRLTQVVARLADDPGVSPLPARVAVFGATRLSATELVVIDALALHRDVHLYIPQPSPRLWTKLAQQRTERGLTRRRSDPTSGLPEHPLLRSLGRDSRELQLRLSAGSAPMIDHHLHLDPAVAAGSAPPTGLTALQRLHLDLADDRRPPGPDGARDERAVLDPGDASIRIHACHGRDRQIEVLRDVLVGLLADDETLQPRDILVMCPDIELYAPLVLAAFGVGDAAVQPSSHPGTGIRVRLADRALRRTNPVLDVLARMLELADSRMTASEVLDFAALQPVRRRFSFDDDDLLQLRTWVADAGIRWGINEPGRARFALPGVWQNTWRRGLMRVLLGVAMSEDVPQFVGQTLPLDDVDSSRISLAGRFAELIDRLALTAGALTGEQSFSAWVGALSTAVDTLTAVSGSDAWQQEQAHRMLLSELDLAGDGARRPLRLQDIRAVLADALQGRPTRSNFRTGELTICSMVPMRSVPHRVICLLGLDDGEFPRAGRVDGDDVLAVDPVVGERDRTSEDRQLLLDAVDAASEHLVFLYSGADHRTGAERPPAAALGEILDVLDATLQDGAGGSVRDLIHVRHPLQPFDDRNFLPDSELVAPRAGADARPFSFDASALEGATALRASALHLPSIAGLLVPTALPPREHRPGDVVEVDQLIRFFEQPAARFLAERLGLDSNWREDPPVDELETDLDGLQKWAIGDRLVRLQLDGIGRQESIAAENRRGVLPVGARAAEVMREVAELADPVVAAGLRHRAGSRSMVDVSIGLEDGRALVGTLGPVHGGRLVTVGYSRPGPKQRLRNWISGLVLAAAGAQDDGAPGGAVWIGQGRRGQQAETVVVAPDPAGARGQLVDLLAIRDLGMRVPLPVTPRLGWAYAEKRIRFGVDQDTAWQIADTLWSRDKYRPERTEAAHRMCWQAAELADIADLPGIAALPNPGAERTMLGNLAMQIWSSVVRDEVDR